MRRKERGTYDIRRNIIQILHLRRVIKLFLQLLDLLLRLPDLLLLILLVLLQVLELVGDGFGRLGLSVPPTRAQHKKEAGQREKR